MIVGGMAFQILRRLEIDHKLEPGWLLDRDIGEGSSSLSEQGRRALRHDAIARDGLSRKTSVLPLRQTPGDRSTAGNRSCDARVAISSRRLSVTGVLKNDQRAGACRAGWHGAAA